MPYKSEAQRKFFNSKTGRAKLGEEVVEEFNKESKGMDLPSKAEDATNIAEISQVEKKKRYIEILEIAKASENEAIKIPMIAMAYAPAEDLEKLAEILNDENDHDAIYTDLLFKAQTGNPEGAMNTTYYHTDDYPEELLPGIKKQHEEWKEIKHLNKAITKALANGNAEAAAIANQKLTKLVDFVVRDAAEEIIKDGGPGSGNHNHKGLSGKWGGSSPKKGSKNKKKKKKG